MRGRLPVSPAACYSCGTGKTDSSFIGKCFSLRVISVRECERRRRQQRIGERERHALPRPIKTQATSMPGNPARDVAPNERSQKLIRPSRLVRAHPRVELRDRNGATGETVSLEYQV